MINEDRPLFGLHVLGRRAEKRKAGVEGDDEGRGPRAAPGAYRVQLTVADQSLEHEFTLLPDPRLSVSLDDLKAQLHLQLAVRDRASEKWVAAGMPQGDSTRFWLEAEQEIREGR